MVRYVLDRKHGFGERPHYEAHELDIMFEQLAVAFLRKKYGKAEFPFSTEDLKIFIESHVEDLDQYADLTKYGAGVEGLTEFVASGKPKVAISEHLQRNENRQRTTLAHEFGHVHLHAYLFEMKSRQVDACRPITSRTRSIVTAIRCSPRPRWTGANGRQATPAAPC
jgi:hypothetical protein